MSWLYSSECHCRYFSGHLIDKVKKKQEICTVWINYMRDKGKKVGYGQYEQTILLSKELMVDWIPADRSCLHENFWETTVTSMVLMRI